MAAITYRLPAVLGAGEALHEHNGRGDGITTVRLLNDGDPTDVLVALDARHLTLITGMPEPAAGSLVEIDDRIFWHRHQGEWQDVGNHAIRTWAALCAHGDPVLLVAEPKLRKLEAVADAAKAWVESIKDPLNVWGDDQDRALLDAAVALGAEYRPNLKCGHCGNAVTGSPGDWVHVSPPLQPHAVDGVEAGR